MTGKHQAENSRHVRGHRKKVCITPDMIAYIVTVQSLERKE